MLPFIPALFKFAFYAFYLYNIIIFLFQEELLMCSGLIHRLLPDDKVLTGVIAMDFDGPVLYQYDYLGRNGFTNLKRTGSIICKFRGKKKDLIQKIKRMRKYYRLPDRLELKQAA